MNTLLSTTISLIIGSVIVVGGVTANTDDILAEATSAVNRLNVHQIATALELYYSDHTSYPMVEGGEAMIETLYDERYIMNKPLDPSVFEYQPASDGQDYTFSLK